MTSEHEIRRIVTEEARLTAGAFDDLCDRHPNLTGTDWDRFYVLLRTWPILDLPVPDRDGCLWPLHGRNYGHVRRATVHRHYGDPVPGVVISRGGPGEASRHTSMTLTRQEALELASLLTAAAMEEA